MILSKGGLAISDNFSGVSFGLQIEHQSLRQMGFIFHHENAEWLRHRALPDWFRRSVQGISASCNRSVVPFPSPSLKAVASPPCCRAIVRTRKRPSPVPFTFSVLLLGTR